MNDPRSSRADAAANSTADKLNIVSQKPEAAEPEEIEVERDPETGAIVRVVGQEKVKENPLNDPLNELEDSDSEEWNGFAMVPEEQSENPVIQQLEEAARRGVKKAPRSQSQREVEWVVRLVEKYGDDYERMSRDLKLNPMQQTAANIRKRVKKWKESNGQQKPWG